MLRQVSAVLSTVLLAATAAASDVVIKRDGKKLTGKVKSCIGSRCQFDSQSIPRDEIAWIGLDAKSTFPPTVVDPYNDEVHLVEGGIESGALITLNLGQIVTEKSNFKRADVLWIHFAPPNKNEGPVIDDSGGAQEAPPAPVPQPAPAPPTRKPGPAPEPQPKSKKPPPTKTPPSEKAKPPGQAMKQCPADNPMGGLVVFDAQYNRGRHNCFETVHTVLRFPLVPFWHAWKQSPWPALVGLGFNESKIDYQISSTGCSGTKGDQECHEPAGRSAGTWVRTPLDTTLPIIHFSAVKPNLDAVSMPPEIAGAFKVSFDCQGRSGGGHTTTTVGFGGFSILDLKDYHCVHFDMVGEQTKAFVFCAAPTGDCPEPDSLPGSECAQHADRHATFPFSGEASWQSTNPNDELVSTKIRWDICCGCAAKAAPPDAIPRDEPKDDCNEEIERLRGKKRGLEDAAALDRKDIAAKAYERDKAFKEAFGPGLLKFSNAVLGVLTKLGDGKWSKVAGLVSAVIANAENNTDLTNLAVAIEAATSPAVIDPALQNAYNTALQKYINDYLATGNEEAARAAFLEGFEEAKESIEKSKQGLEVAATALALIDLAEASIEFNKLNIEYSDAVDELKEAEEQLESAEDQIKDVDVEIQKLLAKCPNAGGENASATGGPSSRNRLVSLILDAAPQPAAADSLAVLKAKSAQLTASTQASEQRFTRSVLPYLIPFMTGQWRQTDPRVLRSLLKGLEPQLRTLLNELQQEAALGREIETLANTVKAAGTGAAPPANARGMERQPSPRSASKPSFLFSLRTDD